MCNADQFSMNIVYDIESLDRKDPEWKQNYWPPFCSLFTSNSYLKLLADIVNSLQ